MNDCLQDIEQENPDTGDVEGAEGTEGTGQDRIIWEIIAQGELAPKTCRDLMRLFRTGGPWDSWYVKTTVEWHVPLHRNVERASILELHNSYKQGRKYHGGKIEMTTVIRVADKLFSGTVQILEDSGLAYLVAGNWTFKSVTEKDSIGK